MDKKHVASVWYFLAAFLILMALQDYVFAPHVETLSYGEFKTLVEKERSATWRSARSSSRGA